MHGDYAKLSPCGLGWGLGVVMALTMIFVGFMTMFFGWGGEFVASMSSMYIGYSATWLGIVIGAVWGFVDGFIGGFLIAWFYNMCSCKRKE